MILVLECDAHHPMQQRRAALLEANGCDVLVCTYDNVMPTLAEHDFEALVICEDPANESLDLVIRDFRLASPRGRVIAIESTAGAMLGRGDVAIDAYDPETLLLAVISPGEGEWLRRAA